MDLHANRRSASIVLPSSLISRRNLAFSLALLAGLAVVATTPQLGGDRVAHAFAQLGEASPAWLWLTGAAFVTSLLCAAGCWFTAVRVCGGRLAFGDAAACYGVGSLVNSFAPARLRDAVRI